MKPGFVGIVRITMGSLLMVTLAVCAFIEIVAAVPMNFDVYRVTWILATAVSALVVLLRQPMKHRLLTIGAYVAFSFALGALSIVPWTPRKPFVRDLGRIKLGMTKVQVKEIMINHGQGTGYPATVGSNGRNYHYRPPAFGEIADYPPRPGYGHLEMATSPTGELAFKDSLAFHHNTSSRFNCDWGVVIFRDGRVTSVVFLPD